MSSFYFWAFHDSKESLVQSVCMVGVIVAGGAHRTGLTTAADLVRP